MDASGAKTSGLPLIESKLRAPRRRKGVVERGRLERLLLLALPIAAWELSLVLYITVT